MRKEVNKKRNESIEQSTEVGRRVTNTKDVVKAIEKSILYVSYSFHRNEFLQGQYFSQMPNKSPGPGTRYLLQSC